MVNYRAKESYENTCQNYIFKFYLSKVKGNYDKKWIKLLYVMYRKISGTMRASFVLPFFLEVLSSHYWTLTLNSCTSLLAELKLDKYIKEIYDIHRFPWIQGIIYLIQNLPEWSHCFFLSVLFAEISFSGVLYVRNM